MKTKYLFLIFGILALFLIANVSAMATINPANSCSNSVNTFLSYNKVSSNTTLTTTQGDSVSLSMAAMIPIEPLGMEQLEIVSNKLLFTDYLSGNYNSVADMYTYTKSYSLNTQTLAPGTYTLKFTAFSQNDCSSDSSTLTLIVKPKVIPDTTAPKVKILFPVNGATYSQNVTNMTFTATDNNLSSCTYKLNNDAPITINNPVNGTNVVTGISSVEGSNTWSVTCFDKAGNNATDSVTFNVKANDTSSIWVNITYPTDGATYSHNIHFMSFDVGGNNSDHCTYKLNDGPANLFSSPEEINFVIGISSVEGSNTWSVTCFDKAGNNATDSVTFYVNTTNKFNDSAPIVKISSPENKTYTTNVTKALFNITGSSTNYSCMFSLNGVNTDISPCQNATMNTIKNLGSKEGENHLTVYAKDNSGKVGSDEVYYYINTTINNSDNLTITPINPLEGNVVNPEIIFKAKTNKDANVTYSLDGATNITMSKIVNYLFNSSKRNLSAGNHRVLFCANDSIKTVCTLVNFSVKNNTTNTNSTNETSACTADCCNNGPREVPSLNITKRKVNRPVVEDNSTITLNFTNNLNFWQKLVYFLKSLVVLN